MIIKKIDNFLKKKKIYKARYIYIYSDFINFFRLYRNNKLVYVEKFLDLFLKRNITLIIPAYSYTAKNRFDVKKTASKAGFLANYIMRNKKFVRSYHPFFSYISIGPQSKILKKLGKSAFGKQSIYSKLRKNNCYFFHLDRDLSLGNTLMHHIEKINKAKYRYEMIIKTKVYENNKYIGTNFSAFMRKNLNSKYHLSYFKRAGKLLKKKRYIYKTSIKGIKIFTYEFDKIFYDLSKMFKKDNEIFISKKDQ